MLTLQRWRAGWRPWIAISGRTLRSRWWTILPFAIPQQFCYYLVCFHTTSTPRNGFTLTKKGCGVYCRSMQPSYVRIKRRTNSHVPTLLTPYPTWQFTTGLKSKVESGMASGVRKIVAADNIETASCQLNAVFQRPRFFLPSSSRKIWPITLSHKVWVLLWFRLCWMADLKELKKPNELEDWS